MSIVSFWGQPTMGDVLIALKAVFARGTGAKRTVVVDTRHLASTECASFARFCREVAQRMRTLLGTKPSVVVLTAKSMGDVFANPPRATMELGPEAQVFDDVFTCVKWIAPEPPAEPGIQLTAILSELETLVARLSSEGSLVSQARAEVRARLAQGASDLSLASIAETLRTSSRSLQRKLATAGTSFREEVRVGRAEKAIELLETTDLKLEGVAYELGFQRVQNFSAAFREVTGTGPREWRRTHRARPERA